MKTFKANSSRGMTLIELMIAMLIGVFLIGGILQIFLSAKQAYRLQENLSRLQENGRFAMQFIARDVRMAGYSGCASKTPLVSSIEPKPPNPNPAVILELDKGLLGANNVSNNWDSSACTTSNLCTPNTDAIKLQTAYSCGANLIGNLVPSNAQIHIPSDNTCEIEAYDVLIAADCSKSEAFIASAASQSLGQKQNIPHSESQNTQSHLKGSFGSDSELIKPKLVSYFIRQGAGGLPSLYLLDNSKTTAPGTNPVELVEGIEDMQILYGVDKNPQDYVPDYYVDADGVASSEWAKNVITVRVNVLAVSIDDALTDQAQAYSFIDKDTNTLVSKTPTDRKIRRMFSSTIALRNKMP